MILKVIHWIISVIGGRRLLYFALLLLGIGSVTYGLTETVNGLEIYYSLIIVLLGIITSWFLAKSQVNSWIGILLLIIFGIGLLVIITGNLMGPLFSLLKSINHLIAYNSYPTLDFTAYMEGVLFSYSVFISGLENTFFSVKEWALSLYGGMPIFDQVSISLVWGILIWCLSGWATWSLTRNRSVILSMLPGGVVLSITSSFTWAKVTPFILFTLSTLLLLALENFDQSEVQWQNKKMDYPEDLSVDFGLVATGLAVGIVFVASLVPSFSVKALIELAQNITSHHIEDTEPVFNSFGLTQSELSKKGFAQSIDAGFPRSHLIGGAPELEENIIMTVRPVGFQKMSEDEIANMPFYWRAYTYDSYSGLGWRSSDIILRTYEPGAEVIEISLEDFQILEFDINILDGGTGILYSFGEILSADNVFKIAYRPAFKDAELLKTQADFFSASIEKKEYRVRSVIPIITESDLRLAPSSYPEWIEERYLKLPDIIPSRVYQLTEQIIGGRETPYDQAKALEQYLKTFEYSIDVDLPPDEQDMVDYFLFDLQRGYCDYYASSMIVMSRILGLPARLAVGYSTGSYDEINHRYVVTEADAHSWVEVYFPDIGWIPFEPTSGRAEINPIPSVPGVVDTGNFIDEAFPRVSTILNQKLTIINLVFYLFFLSTVLLFFSLSVDEFRLRRLKPSETVTDIYQRLYRLAKRLKADPKRDCTPNQFSSNILIVLDKFTHYRHLQGLRTSSHNEITKLTSIYQRTIYSPWNPDRRIQNQVIKSWKQIRVFIWLAIIHSSLPRWLQNDQQ